MFLEIAIFSNKRVLAVSYLDRVFNAMVSVSVGFRRKNAVLARKINLEMCFVRKRAD